MISGALESVLLLVSSVTALRVPRPLCLQKHFLLSQLYRCACGFVYLLIPFSPQILLIDEKGRPNIELNEELLNCF